MSDFIVLQTRFVQMVVAMVEIVSISIQLFSIQLFIYDKYVGWRQRLCKIVLTVANPVDCGHNMNTALCSDLQDKGY